MIVPVKAERGFTAPFFTVRMGEPAAKFSLILTRALTKMLIRWEGGCGFMSPQDASGMYELFLEAFRGVNAAFLFGGTRMLALPDMVDVVPSITEVPPLLLEANPGCVALGVIPKTQEYEAVADVGNVVSRAAEYVTIAHPYQTSYIMVDAPLPRPKFELLNGKVVPLGSGGEPVESKPWDNEYIMCLHLMEQLRSFAGFSLLTVVYNGGLTTAKAIQETADRGWPLLIIYGSGRMADEYAGDAAWLRQYPNVSVCHNDVASLRAALVKAGVVQNKLGELRAVPRQTG